MQSSSGVAHETLEEGIVKLSLRDKFVLDIKISNSCPFLQKNVADRRAAVVSGLKRVVLPPKI